LGTTEGLAEERFKTRYGYAALDVPVCLYAPAVLVHKDSPYEGGLPVERMEAIFSSGFRDLTWGDLGCVGEWTERRISVHASGHHAKWLRGVLGPRFGLFWFKDGVQKCADDGAVVAAIAEGADRIGLASIGRCSGNVRALAIAPKGSDVAVEPTAENARNGTYPLTGVFHLTLNHDPEGGFELDPLRREFLRYVLSREGQEAVVKAGYVSLSEKQAWRILTRIGLRLTGDGPWDEILSRLRARGLPDADILRIEQMVRTLGEEPTQEQLLRLANTLGRTGLKSAAVFAAAQEGATVRYRFLSQVDATPMGEPTRRVEATLPIGLYHVWTERDGKPTSPTDAWFPVLREQERIKVYETR
jgi:hypothetical protein